MKVSIPEMLVERLVVCRVYYDRQRRRKLPVLRTGPNTQRRKIQQEQEAAELAYYKAMEAVADVVERVAMRS